MLFSDEIKWNKFANHISYYYFHDSAKDSNIHA